MMGSLLADRLEGSYLGNSYESCIGKGYRKMGFGLYLASV